MVTFDKVELTVEFVEVSLLVCPVTKLMDRKINKAKRKLKMLRLLEILLKSISNQIKLY